MKKKIAATLISLLTITSVFAGCGSSADSSSSEAASTETASVSEAEGSEESAAESTSVTSDELGEDAEYDEEVNIMVIIKTSSSEVGQYLTKGATSYEEAHPNVHVDVFGATSETAYDEQLNSIETTINSGKYDALCLAPLQSDAAATMLANCDIPVISFDTVISDDVVETHVGVGNTEAAKAGAIAAVEAAKEAGWDEINCIEIAGVQGDPTNEARMEGYKEGINEAGGTFLEDEIQYADAVADRAVNCMESIMSKYPEGVAIICCNNDDMAIGAAKAAAQNEAYADTIFLGFDGMSSAAEVIVNGTVNNYLSVACEWTEMTYKAVDCAIRAIKGEELPGTVNTSFEIMDSSNAQERLDYMNSLLD
ncbi:MAG: sugar ABC transporter substrate-binding protein [Lachnospiraceae bacterium]|nr:sugar ABC transporter substrate-binding protein [Lachnospiraceae bacterium]